MFLALNDKKNPMAGMHFMTAQYTGKEYVIYKVYNNYTDVILRPSLDAIDDNYAWMYGYILGG